MAGSHFKRQALESLSFTRITWNWLEWIVCRLLVVLSIALFPYLFLVHFPYENVIQYCYAQGSYGNSLAPIPGLVCFMKMIAATTYWAFNMYWASTECWFLSITNSSSLSPPNKAWCCIVNGVVADEKRQYQRKTTWLINGWRCHSLIWQHRERTPL